MIQPDPLCLYCYTRKPSAQRRYNRQYKCCNDCEARYPPDIVLEDWLDVDTVPKAISPTPSTGF